MPENAWKLALGSTAPSPEAVKKLGSRGERALPRSLLRGEPIEISTQSSGELQRASPTTLRQFFLRSPC